MLISLLVALIVGCLLVWAARRIIAAFGVPEPFGTVIYVVIVLIVVLSLLGYVHPYGRLL